MTYTCVYCNQPINGIMVGAGDGDGQKFAHPDCYWRAEYKRVVESVKDADSAWDLAVRRCMSVVANIGQHDLVYNCHGKPVYPHYKMIAEMQKILIRKEG